MAEQLYYCSIDGNESGPFNAEQLKQLVKDGRLSKTDSVRREQSRNWHAAGSMRGLYSDTASSPGSDSTIIPPSISEPTYWYYDSKTANRLGPYTTAELRQLAFDGRITDETIIENQAGQTMEYKLIKGPILSPPKPDDDGGNNAPFSFFGWIFDFGFKHSYVMKIIRLLMSITYAIELVLILLGGICFCFTTFGTAMYGLSHNQASALLMFLLIPLILVGVAVCIVSARLGCEYFLFFVDWMVSTKKAADKFNAK
jgi:hypothetical protein